MPRRTWNPRFLAGRAARWLLAALVVLPAALLLGSFLFLIWLLWLATSGLQAGLLMLRAPGGSDRFPHVAGAKTDLSPGTRRTLHLPTPRLQTTKAGTQPSDMSGRSAGPRNPSLEDVQQSLAGMASHGWTKPQVIAALEAAGAAWMWTEPIDPASAEAKRVAGARERVHLRYRPGRTILQRYALPAARINAYFGESGHLIKATAMQNRRL